MDTFLQAARAECIKSLLRATARNCLPEPALRCADGSLAYDPEGLRTPLRKDVGIMEGNQCVTSNVAALTIKPLSPFHTIWKDQLIIVITSITWDYTTFRLRTSHKSSDIPSLRDWFLHWFDPGDTNQKTDAGLYGVVHFVSDPIIENDRIELAVDFGSAPIQAFHELLDCFVSAGVTHCDVT